MASSAVAERGLLRLLQRLEDGAGDGAGAEGAAGAADASSLVADLEELSAVWTRNHHHSSKAQELVSTLGRHLQSLPKAACGDAVLAFVPLQEDVKQRMASTTAALNSWLAQHSEDASESVEEPLSQLESVSYLPCYRWVGDTNFRLRFLVSLGLVLQKLQPKEAQENGEISTCQQLAEKLSQRYFTMENSEAVLGRWLAGRMARYDRSWRRAAQIARGAGFVDELRRRLGKAIEEAATQVGAKAKGCACKAEAEWVQIPRWPMKFPVAQAMTSFVVEYLAPSAPRQGLQAAPLGQAAGVTQHALPRAVSSQGLPKMTPRSEHRRLAECPEHSLQPAALLQILYDLKEPFEVRESEEPNVDPVGAVRLTEHWSSLKDLPDKAPPPQAPALPQAPRKAAKVEEKVQVDAAEPKAVPAVPSTVTSIATVPAAASEAPAEAPAEAAEAAQGEEAAEAKRSRSRSGESLQPKLIKKRKAGAKAEVPKANETSADAKKPEPETVDLEEAEKTPEKSVEKPKARPPLTPFHGHPMAMAYGMWGHPMALPPRPGMMPPMGMPPPYGMPMKRKKEKKGHKDRDKRDRREESKDRNSSESRKKKKEKKEKKKEKKEKHR